MTEKADKIVRVTSHLSASLFVFVAALGAATCRRAQPHDAPAPKACTSNQDCDDGWACLAQRCYDTRKSAAFTHPEQQVTPDRVRQEVEHQQDQHMQRIEKDLENEGAPMNR